MNTMLTKFAGWYLLLMMAILIIEILAVGIFAAGWCLHTVFGHYGIAVVALIALVAALVHEHQVHHQPYHTA